MPVVPTEPTPDMCIAGGIAMCEARETAETAVDEAAACWKAMLQAALPSSAADRIALLEGALRPFAEAAQDLDDDHKDESPIWECPAAMGIDAGHLRQAAQALAETEVNP